MDVDLTDQTPLETGNAPKLDVEVDVGDLGPLSADRAADGTRSKLTAAPPPIPARARSKNTLPPPIPQRAAKGTIAPRPSKPSLVEPKATPEMMASWQINPEAPLAPPVKAPVGTLPTTIELVRAPMVVPATKLDAEPSAPMVTGNAPSVATESATALPVVQQEIIPSPRESRVTQLPTSQPGADVADLPVWPQSAPKLGEVLAARASSSKLPPPRGRNTLPPPIPTAPTPEVRAPKVPTLGMPAVEPESLAMPNTLDGSDGWVFEDDYEERQVDGEVVPTTYFERSEPLPAKRPRYLLALGAGAAAIAVIVAFAMHGSSTTTLTPTKLAATESAPAPAPAAATPAPAPAPAPAAATAAPTPALTTLPITSWPNGATVTLVDNGNATVLGRTPVNAALDPSHSYDVVFAVVGRPTLVKHIDLGSMRELAVDLDASAPTPVTAHVAAAVAPAAAPSAPVAAPTVAAHAPETHHHHRQPTLAIATPDFAATPVAKPKQVAGVATAPSAPAVAAAPAGNGTLMISSKPPCEILIDGKPTRLTTPQHALSLSTGTHTVTLVNATIGIRKQIAVKVDAKKPTKLIQDFTKS